MKKLNLHLDDLRIDTFSTTPAEKLEGTVVGEQLSCADSACCYSCGATCRGSCPPDTCYRTCRADDTCFMAAC
jgi:hypothetical protein